MTGSYDTVRCKTASGARACFKLHLVARQTRLGGPTERCKVVFFGGRLANEKKRGDFDMRRHVMRRHGRCLCDEVRIETSDQHSGLDICHCKNCQLQTGSPFAAFLAVPLEGLKISGPLRRFDDMQTVSGNVVERFFCETCGSPCYVRVQRAPNTAYVFSGLFDETDDLAPKVHGWTSQKHRWVEVDNHVEQFAVDPGLFPE